MKQFVYKTTSQLKSTHVMSVTNDDCIRLYLRHYRNVLLLERIKGLFSDFAQCQSIETEISIGLRKCDYWYNRANFQGCDVVSRIRDIKVAINSIDISVFK